MSSSDEFSSKGPVIIAAVEGGGTSFCVAVCRVGLRPIPTILKRIEVDSSHEHPHRTLKECAAFLEKHKPSQGYHALGLASFGPFGVNVDNKADYGKILATSPKAAWRRVDILTPLQKACQGSRPLAVKVETDVNAPALAEHLQEKDSITSLAYITVGTGVGVGLIVNGKPVHGRMHPEGGHVPIHPLPGDTFGGYSWGKEHSPFEGRNTVEGLASSIALSERLAQWKGVRHIDRSVLRDLPDNHELWDHAANAIANLCATLLLTLSIEKIVIGGGILQRKGLMEQIRSRTVQLLNGYLPLPLPKVMSTLITSSRFGSDAGLTGAMVLAQRALTSDEQDHKRREKKMKQVAYGHGLWHGILVGVAGTALVFKYLVGDRRRQ